MARVTTAALGSEPSMTEAANAILAKAGTSVDACIAAFFAAAGAQEGVLLGSVVMLVAGTGSGAHVFDGSVVQPGRGVPRPRGFTQDSEVPVSARIGVSATGAVLAAVHAHGGSTPMSELATPGVKIARACRAPGRANLIRRVSAAGPVALREASFVRSLLDVAGRPEGGNVTTEDLEEVQARVLQPTMGEGVLFVEAPASRLSIPALRTVVLVACDHRGVLAAMHCAYDTDGVNVEPHEVTASRLAAPVLRGVPRIRPGTPIELPIPIGLLTDRDIPWAAVGLEGVFHVDWDRLAGRIAPDLTLEQSLRMLVAEAGPDRRALAVARGLRADDVPRVHDIKSGAVG